MLDPRIKQCLLTSHDRQHLTVHACSIFSIIHLFFLMSENKHGSLRSFCKDYPQILANESKHWKAFKNLSCSMSLLHSDSPPPAKSIDHFFSKDNKIWWKPALWAFFWSAFTPGLAGSTLPVEAGGCTGVPFSVMQVWASPPSPPPHSAALALQRPGGSKCPLWNVSATVHKEVPLLNFPGRCCKYFPFILLVAFEIFFSEICFFLVATLLTWLGAVHLLPQLFALCIHFDCCIYHPAAVLYIMVIGKWMSSAGLMCIPCHMFQSFIKIKTWLFFLVDTGCRKISIFVFIWE